MDRLCSSVDNIIESFSTNLLKHSKPLVQLAAAENVSGDNVDERLRDTILHFKTNVAQRIEDIFIENDIETRLTELCQLQKASENENDGVEPYRPSNVPLDEVEGRSFEIHLQYQEELLKLEAKTDKEIKSRREELAEKQGRFNVLAKSVEQRLSNVLKK